MTDIENDDINVGHNENDLKYKKQDVSVITLTHYG